MPTPQTKETAQPSLGYELIEKLLETEDFAGINKSFAEAYQKLEKILADRDAGLKKQKEARKAMRAYELTTDLVKELLKIKYQLLKAKESQSGSDMKGKRL